jgi:hypothetical protein
MLPRWRPAWNALWSSRSVDALASGVTLGEAEVDALIAGTTTSRSTVANVVIEIPIVLGSNGT